jgi:glycine dehydrogenase subunit 1
VRYIPHTEAEIRHMLEVLGIDAVDRLFECIPPRLRLGQKLAVPEALDEVSLIRTLSALALNNSGSADRMAVFIGAGAYAHHVPAAVDQLLLRGEFFTAYTPYQAEVSQGTLQAIFEYQSMMAELLGVEVVNASMYDGASATAEAALMAQRLKKKRRKTLFTRALHPEVRATCRTYLSEKTHVPDDIPFDPSGQTNLAALRAQLDSTVAAVVVQQPNALGCIEPLDQIAAIVHEADAVLVVAVLEPVSLGILEAPGNLGADIVTGEGLGLSVGLNFGGPGLGIFGCSKKNSWQMPGRLVGETTDNRGQRAFVLTMSSREQHIRRARATSNICSNEGLCSLAAAINLSLLGKAGFADMARTNAINARAALARLMKIPGVTRVFKAPFFNEFAVRIQNGVAAALKKLEAASVLGGFALERFYPELSDCLLLCVTEQHTAAQIERYAAALAG